MEDGDDQLLARVAQGDGAAFSHLVTRHRAKLMAIAVRIVASRAVAEEIVQEVFTRAWIHAPQWRPQTRSAFGAWLSRVTTNLAIDQTRRARFAPLEDAPEPIDMTAGADAQLVEDEDRLRLEMAIAALPPRQRAAIALTYDEGLSNAEGAAAMEISVGAFELLLVRARRTLRQFMMDGKTK